MPSSAFKSYVASFKSFKGILGSIGVLVPGFSYFTNYAPPLLNESSFLTAAFAGATVIVAYYYHPPADGNSDKRMPPLIRLAVIVLSTSVFLLIVYLLLLSVCTVVAPGGKERFQTGFDKFEWSLTDEGRQIKADHPNETTQDWLLDDALFRPGGPNVIWKTWTIIVSGVVMVATFILAFVLWSFGWALLAKQKSLDNATEVEPG